MEVREKATDLVQPLAQKDFFGETCTLLEFVRDQIRYVKDINDVETVHTADKVLELQRGDCDDKAILLAAMLLSIGHIPQFVAVSLDGYNYIHVWVQDNLHGNWIDLEPTEALPCGQSVALPSSARLMTYPV